jgi:hypothetical protein
LQMAYVEVAREPGRARPEPARPGEGAPSPTEPTTPKAEPITPAGESTGAPEPSAPISSTEPETESKKKFTKSYGP